MSSFAIDEEGKPIIADNYNEHDWQALKESYRVGQFLMPCCLAPAIPKTSSNFNQFFAHYSDECGTSPESKWHLSTKEDVVNELYRLGIDALLEQNGGNNEIKWKADILFEYDARKIAIEVQHSYQHLREYLRRQKTYSKFVIEAYWLLFPPRYATLALALGKYRIKNEFGGKLPIGGIFPCIPELPIAYYDISEEQCMIKGAGQFQATLREWILSIISQKFRHEAGAWIIS